jgi:hypothetical protein
MRFVYLHILWFGLWIGLGAEKYPYGLLTMIVSLEAIFLSTFVMISQNRADAKRQVVANLQWRTVREEDRQNEQLLELSQQILELTKAIHASTNRQASRRFSDHRGERASDKERLTGTAHRFWPSVFISRTPGAPGAACHSARPGVGSHSSRRGLTRPAAHRRRRPGSLPHRTRIPSAGSQCSTLS